jgi:hypothetical protein
VALAKRPRAEGCVHILNRQFVGVSQGCCASIQPSASSGFTGSTEVGKILYHKPPSA